MIMMMTIVTMARATTPPAAIPPISEARVLDLDCVCGMFVSEGWTGVVMVLDVRVWRRGARVLGIWNASFIRQLLTDIEDDPEARATVVVVPDVGEEAVKKISELAGATVCTVLDVVDVGFDD